MAVGQKLDLIKNPSGLDILTQGDKYNLTVILSMIGWDL